MKNFSKYYTFGILIILQTVHSFVLLTANIEDVKKLATKFVSESLADKIAEFLARATDSMFTNISQETNDRVSEENKKYNVKIARERKEDNNGRPLEDLSVASYEGYDPVAEKKDKTHSVDRITEENFIKSKRVTNNMYKKDMRFVKPIRDRYVDVQNEFKKIGRDNKNDLRIKEGKETPVIDKELKTVKRIHSNQQNKENSNYIQKRHKIKLTNAEPTHVESTKGDTEEVRVTELNKKILKTRIELKIENTKAKPIEVTNSTAYDESILRAIKELTTSKIKTEFDQYDNTNYPKPDFIATSGDVALTKVPKNNKWRIDAPKEDSQKKFWF